LYILWFDYFYDINNYFSSLVEKNKGGFTYAIKRENINYFNDELQEYVMNSFLSDEEKDNICYALQKYKIN